MFPTPLINIPLPGEHMKFDDLEIIFKVDDDLTNYIELFNWFIALGKPDSYSQYADIAAEPIASGLGITCDISALIRQCEAKRQHGNYLRGCFCNSPVRYNFRFHLGRYHLH